jgi:hypothetical protein
MTKSICISCDSPYNEKRAALGYKMCIDCALINPSKPNVFLADVSKSNPTITSNSENVCILSGVEGSSDQSKAGAKSMISLRSYSNDKLYNKD